MFKIESHTWIEMIINSCNNPFDLTFHVFFIIFYFVLLSIIVWQADKVKMLCKKCIDFSIGY